MGVLPKGKEKSKQITVVVYDDAVLTYIRDSPAVEVNNVDKLPKPPYNIYKEKKIRDMLSEHGLSTAGSKEQLVSRHAQYTIFFPPMDYTC